MKSTNLELKQWKCEAQYKGLEKLSQLTDKPEKIYSVLLIVSITAKMTKIANFDNHGYLNSPVELHRQVEYQKRGRNVADCNF